MSLNLIGQSQKKAANFDSVDFKETIQQTFDSLRTELKLEWVYYKVANFDTAFHSSEQLPSPNFITNFGFSNIELQTEDFNNILILKEIPENLFKIKVNQIDSLYPIRKEKFGNGLVFSLPYSKLSEKGKFVDIEVINWDWCGTGSELRVDLKE